MKVVVLILGVLAVLLGGFWTVQGLDLVTVEPLLCASACETIEGPSASWTLIGLDWRVDRVSASSRAARLDTDVIYLTLRYREGDSVDRVTLQLSTKGVRDLRAFLQRFES